MASQHLYPTTSTRLANELTNLLRQMWDANASFNRIKAILDQVAADGDWKSLMLEFGFATEEEATTFYNLFTGAYYAWNDKPGGNENPVQHLLARMG